MLAPVQRMFVQFHAKLRRYEPHRICHCGACQSAHHLTLKFIVHYGPVSLNDIHGHLKLFGKDVIVAHRLLTHDLESHDYDLFTAPLQKAAPGWQPLPSIAWEQPQTGSHTYDSGTVDFAWLPLHPLYEQVPEPRLEEYSPGAATMKLFEVQGIVNAPLDMVFDVLSDVSFRNQWQEELDSNWVIDHINSRIPQHGTTHRCVSGGPTLVSHNFRNDGNVVRFTETNPIDESSHVFVLRKEGLQRTTMQAVFFIKPNLVKKWFFHLFLKKKVVHTIERSICNIAAYCRELQQEGRHHQLRIVLEESVQSEQE